MTASPPLRGLRVVVTRPPDDWFYGLAHQYAARYAETLRAMGATVMAIPILPFLTDEAGAATLVEEVAAFRPDLAFGLHDAGYAILCRARRGTLRAPTNVFVDWLELPTVLLWDHGLMQFAPLLLGPLPDDPEQSTPGCLQILRSELAHPLFLHVARDRGHREVADGLGVLPRERVLLEPAFAHPGFFPSDDGAAAPTTDLAFFGNVRSLDLDRRPARHHEALGTLREAAFEETLAHLDRPLWDALTRRLAELPPSVREALHLDPDHSFYWSLLCSEAEVAQTRLRMAILERLDRPIDVYGDLGAWALGGRATARPERFAFGHELASAFRRARIVVDVVNPGFIHGFGTKVMNCFAAGGFMLLDRRGDFVELFGALGDAVSYASTGELEAKIDRFLSRPDERAELASALGRWIRAVHSLPSVLVRTVERALALRR